MDSKRPRGRTRRKQGSAPAGQEVGLAIQGAGLGVKAPRRKRSTRKDAAIEPINGSPRYTLSDIPEPLRGHPLQRVSVPASRLRHIRKESLERRFKLAERAASRASSRQSWVEDAGSDPDTPPVDAVDPEQKRQPSPVHQVLDHIAVHREEEQRVLRDRIRAEERRRLEAEMVIQERAREEEAKRKIMQEKEDLHRLQAEHRAAFERQLQMQREQWEKTREAEVSRQQDLQRQLELEREQLREELAREQQERALHAKMLREEQEQRTRYKAEVESLKALERELAEERATRAFLEEERRANEDASRVMLEREKTARKQLEDLLEQERAQREKYETQLAEEQAKAEQSLAVERQRIAKLQQDTDLKYKEAQAMIEEERQRTVSEFESFKKERAAALDEERQRLEVERIAKSELEKRLREERERQDALRAEYDRKLEVQRQIEAEIKRDIERQRAEQDRKHREHVRELMAQRERDVASMQQLEKAAEAGTKQLREELMARIAESERRIEAERATREHALREQAAQHQHKYESLRTHFERHQAQEGLLTSVEDDTPVSQSVDFAALRRRSSQVKPKPVEPSGPREAWLPPRRPHVDVPKQDAFTTTTQEPRPFLQYNHTTVSIEPSKPPARRMPRDSALFDAHVPPNSLTAANMFADVRQSVDLQCTGRRLVAKTSPLYRSSIGPLLSSTNREPDEPPESVTRMRWLVDQQVAHLQSQKQRSDIERENNFHKSGIEAIRSIFQRGGTQMSQHEPSVHNTAPAPATYQEVNGVSLQNGVTGYVARFTPAPSEPNEESINNANEQAPTRHVRKAWNKPTSAAPPRILDSLRESQTEEDLPALQQPLPAVGSEPDEEVTPATGLSPRPTPAQRRPGTLVEVDEAGELSELQKERQQKRYEHMRRKLEQRKREREERLAQEPQLRPSHNQQTLNNTQSPHNVSPPKSAAVKQGPSARDVHEKAGTPPSRKQGRRRPAPKVKALEAPSTPAALLGLGSKRSNKRLIENALSYVCLAGKAMAPEKLATVTALRASKQHHFIILLKSAPSLKYKGLYVLPSPAGESEQCALEKLAGEGPSQIRQNQVDSVFKYDSAGKQFNKIRGHLGPTTDAVTLKRRSNSVRR